MVTRTCEACHETFSYEPSIINGREIFARHYCPPCGERISQEYDAATETARNAELAAHRAATWQGICPPLYDETDPERIPPPFRSAITGWKYSPRGLGLIGPAGQCKTRASYTLLRRMHDAGLSCDAVTATAFARLCIHQFSEDKNQSTRSARKLSSLRDCDVLLIDDLGKSKMTERCEVEFFDLLEHRTSHLHPTIWTANARGDELLALMSPDRGEPILRRLAEFSEIVTV